MLSEKYIENAKEIKKILLEHPDFCPTMDVWNELDTAGKDIKESVICGTAMCIAGMQACIDGYPKEYFCSEGFFDHEKFSEEKCGHDSFEKEWVFMYASYWPNDREKAIARCDYVIQHGNVPDRLEWDNFR